MATASPVTREVDVLPAPKCHHFRFLTTVQLIRFVVVTIVVVIPTFVLSINIVVIVAHHESHVSLLLCLWL